MCGAVSEAEKQWRLQKVGEVKNVDHLKKAARNEQSQHKKEATKVTITNSIIGVESPNHFGILLTDHLES